MQEKQLHLSLSDTAAVHNHYMPMIQSGGLFIPTNESLEFGEKVVAKVTFLAEKQTAVIPGKVVWIVPAGAQRGLLKGVGIELIGEHSAKIRRYIESMLGDSLMTPPKFPSY